MNQAFEKQSDVGTLESLLVSLDLAVEAKKQNDAAIAVIRESLATRIDEMKQAKATLDELMATADSPKPPRLPAVLSQNANALFWQWIVPAVVMFAVLWLMMLVFQGKPQEANAQTALPSQVQTVRVDSPFVGSLFVEANNSIGGDTTPETEVQQPMAPVRNRLFNRFR